MPINDFRLELGQGSELAMAISLGLMMFAVALTINLASFVTIKESPRPFFVGLVGQVFVLPLLTLGLCFVMQPLPSVALGMILIACCPGGNVSNLLVLLARGNAALSVTLTATSSVIAAFVTPLAILFWSGWYPPTADLLDSIEFDSLKFLSQAALILALPLVLGLLINHAYPKLAQRIRRPLVSIAAALLLVIIVRALYMCWHDFLVLGAGLISLVFLHNSLAFSAGYLLARISRLSIEDRRTLTFEVGIQNSGLGIVILLTQLGGLGGAAAVAGLWSTWHIFSGLCLVILFRQATKSSSH